MWRIVLAFLILIGPAEAGDEWFGHVAGTVTANRAYGIVNVAAGITTGTATPGHVIPYAGTYTDIRCADSVAPGAGTSITAQLRQNTVAVGSTCSISGTNTTCSQTGQSVSLAAGDGLDIVVQVTGSPTLTGELACSIKIDPS